MPDVILSLSNFSTTCLVLDLDPLKEVGASAALTLPRIALAMSLAPRANLPERVSTSSLKIIDTLSIDLQLLAILMYLLTQIRSMAALFSTVYNSGTLVFLKSFKPLDLPLEPLLPKEKSP